MGRHPNRAPLEGLGGSREIRGRVRGEFPFALQPHFITYPFRRLGRQDRLDVFAWEGIVGMDFVSVGGEFDWAFQGEGKSDPEQPVFIRFGGSPPRLAGGRAGDGDVGLLDSFGAFLLRDGSEQTTRGVAGDCNFGARQLARHFGDGPLILEHFDFGEGNRALETQAQGGRVGRFEGQGEDQRRLLVGKAGRGHCHPIAALADLDIHAKHVAPGLMEDDAGRWSVAGSSPVATTGRRSGPERNFRRC